jgi:polysaccharide deacetylase family protein (PEP-CTERM system associated)
MNILTFDIEDWFHILGHDSTRTAKEWVTYPTRIHESVNRILNLLDQGDIKATFFCLGWIAERYPEVIKLIDEMGHEIASHSYSHQLIPEMSMEEVRLDLEKSVGVLEDLTGKKIKAYRAPGFSLTAKTPWVFEILNECGIEIDCSLTSARHSHGGEIPLSCKTPQLISYRGVVLKEFPLNTWDFCGRKILFSGGGYFRLFPYWLISRLTRKSDYVMTYFHPRDFDPDQPIIPNLSLVRRYKSYFGLSKSSVKLSKMLSDFSFMSLGEADQSFDWDSAPLHKFG